MNSSAKYIPFGTNGSVAFWEPTSSHAHPDGKQISDWSERGIKTIVCVFSERGSSIITDLEESLHGEDWKLYALEIPLGPETNESVFFCAWKLLQSIGKSNILFLVPEELNERWEVLLSKMVLSSFPHLAPGELGAWFPSLSGDSEPILLNDFKSFISRRKPPREIPEGNRGEFSVFLSELPLSFREISLGGSHPENGTSNDVRNGKNGKPEEKQQIKIKESESATTPESNGKSTPEASEDFAKPDDLDLPVASIESITESNESAADSKLEVPPPKETKKEIQAPVIATMSPADQTKAKFPLQLKLMGVISLLMTVTVSTVILYASSEFKKITKFGF